MNRRLPTILVLLVLVAPALATGVSAQRTEFPTNYLRADLTTSTGFVEVPREETRSVGWTLEDRSGDNRRGEGFPHQYRISARILTPGTVGWSVAAFPSTGFVGSGGTVTGQLQITADPVIEERTITVELEAVLVGQDTREAVATTPVQVRVAPYHDGAAQIQGSLPRLEPQDASVLQIEVRNDAPYPDSYQLDLQSPPGWTVHAADQVTLTGHERTLVDLTVIAPHEDDRFYYEESGLVGIEITSTQDPTETQLDQTSHPIRVEGVHLPPYTLPFFPLLALLAGAFVHRRRKMYHRHRKEKGPPRDPELSPKKQALLAELKERNPQAYQRYVEKIERARELREERYPEHKEEQLESLLEDEGEGDGS